MDWFAAYNDNYMLKMYLERSSWHTTLGIVWKEASYLSPF